MKMHLLVLILHETPKSDKAYQDNSQFLDGKALTQMRLAIKLSIYP